MPKSIRNFRFSECQFGIAKTTDAFQHGEYVYATAYLSTFQFYLSSLFIQFSLSNLQGLMFKRTGLTTNVKGPESLVALCTVDEPRENRRKQNLLKDEYDSIPMSSRSCAFDPRRGVNWMDQRVGCFGV